MGEYENMKLDDEAMAQASGGMALSSLKEMQYDAFGAVVRYLGEHQYLVQLDDGAEVNASFDERHVVEEGASVALTARNGSWMMEEKPLRH